jgi:membrane protease subunit (stomatin/prohibitin family)
MNAIGDMGAFQAYQLGNAMPEAAANPAGGLAGAGVGLGMGLAMTNSMGGLMGGSSGAPPSGSAAPPQAGPPPVPATSWHIAEGGQSVGPFTSAQVAQAVASGRITPDTLVWTVGMREWSAASGLEALAGLFAPQPPPLPDA